MKMLKAKSACKNITSHRFWPPIVSVGVVLVLGLLLTMCFNITNVDQPTTAVAGETISITLDVEVLDDPLNENPGVGGSIFVFGFLAPKSWNAGENTTVSISSEPFSTTLSIMDPNAVPSFPAGSPVWKDFLFGVGGIGENYGEVEWVVFKADAAWNPPAEVLPLHGTVNIQTTVGPKNMITQLGYFIGDAEHGYREINQNFDFFFTDCLEITDGEGETINLCGPPPPPETILLTPSVFGWNDLINIRFDASKGENDGPTRLQGASQIYICATAALTDGTIEVCEKTEATALTFLEGDFWQITIWPKAFFDLADVSGITEITYNLQNQSGNIIVRNPDTGEDFKLEAECK